MDYFAQEGKLPNPKAVQTAPGLPFAARIRDQHLSSRLGFELGPDSSLGLSITLSPGGQRSWLTV